MITQLLIAGGVFFLLFIGFIILISAKAGPAARKRQDVQTTPRDVLQPDNNESAPPRG